MSGDDVVLAELDFGDTTALQAQADELLRAYRESDQPRGVYKGSEPSQSIWVTVNRTVMVTDVQISRTWPDRLAADRFTDALFTAYSAAAQTAMLVESPAAAPPGEVVDPIPADLPVEDWARRVEARLAETDARLAALRRTGDTPPTEEFRGRNGYLTLIFPITIVADPAVLEYADTERLRVDVLDVLAQAGLAELQETDEDTDGDFGFEY